VNDLEQLLTEIDSDKFRRRYYSRPKPTGE